MKNKFVSAVLIADVTSIGLVAVLREQGIFNFGDITREPHPGLCQLTVRGLLKKDEDFPTALFRKLEEELGQDFTLALTASILEHRAVLAEVANIGIGDDKVVATYVIEVDPSLLKRIRLTPSSGAIRLVSLEEIPHIVNFDSATGVKDRNIITMFSDDVSLVNSAFAYACSSD